jgi:hypothetical protein
VNWRPEPTHGVFAQFQKYECSRFPARSASQCMTVTANTTMIAALSEHMTASGTSSLWYVITIPALSVQYKDVRPRFGSMVPRKKRLAVVMVWPLCNCQESFFQPRNRLSINSLAPAIWVGGSS